MTLTFKSNDAIDFAKKVEATFSLIVIPETEQSWDTIAKGITKLTIFCKDFGSLFPAEFISSVKKIVTPLTASMLSERTRLSGAAIDFLSTAATTLGNSFEPFIPLFFPTLLLLCSRSNKVFVTRSRACVFTIVESTQLPSILHHLSFSMKDKAVSLRLVAVEATLRCLNCFNPPDLEKESRAKDIETIIKIAVRDPNADIRKASRNVFEAYKLLVPNRVNNFIAPLSPTSMKYLNIKPTSGDSRPPSRTLSAREGTSRPNSRPNLQSSHLASNLPCTNNEPPRPTRNHTAHHTRTTSSSATITDMPAKKIAAKPRMAKLASHSSMLPPEHVPARPAQRAQPSSSSTTTRSERAPIPDPPRLTRKRSQNGLKAPSGAQELSTKPTSSSAIRPLASSSLSQSVPQRVAPLEPPTALASQSSGAARRVPVVEPPAPQTAPAEEAAQPASRSNSRLDNSQKGVAAPQPKKTAGASLSKKTGLLTTKPTLAAPPLKDPPPPMKPSRSAGSGSLRGLSQPTLSQLARAKQVAEERKPSAGTNKNANAQLKAPIKPWGRLQPRKGPMPKGAIVAKIAKEKEKVLAKARTVPLPPSPTTIAESVALPPSPTPEDKEGPAVDPNQAEPILVSSERSASGLSVSIAQAQTETVTPGTPSPLVLVDEHALEPGSEAPIQLITPEATPKPPNPTINLQPTTPLSSMLGSGSLYANLAPQATPITSLLSSIERGFLFTPASPLSPPHSYLSKGEDMTPLSFVGFGIGGGGEEKADARGNSSPEMGVKKLSEERDRMVFEELANI